MIFSTQTTSLNDRERLLNTVSRAMCSWVTYAPSLFSFRRRLRGSQAVPAEDVPNDLITMNSRFALQDNHTGDTLCYSLVYPEDEAPHAGKLSVLSPMGMVLFGAKVGDEVCWTSADGPQVATVMKLLYQPESAGHHHR